MESTPTAVYPLDAQFKAHSPKSVSHSYRNLKEEVKVDIDRFKIPATVKELELQFENRTATEWV